MRVAVDQAPHAVEGHDAFDFSGRDIADALIAAGLRRGAGGAGLCGEGATRGQRLSEEALLPGRITHLPAEALVGHVVEAEQVAVHQQRRFAVQQDDRRIGQQGPPSARRVVGTDEEIAVAAHEGHGHARVAQRTRRRGHAVCDVAIVVVAEEGFEQVAQQVDRLGLAGLSGAEGLELRRRVRPRFVEVQVGQEQRRHCAVPGRRKARSMTMAWFGTRDGKGPCAPVSALRIASTTSMPSTTRPKTA